MLSPRHRPVERRSALQPYPAARRARRTLSPPSRWKCTGPRSRADLRWRWCALFYAAILRMSTKRSANTARRRRLFTTGWLVDIGWAIRVSDSAIDLLQLLVTPEHLPRCRSWSIFCLWWRAQHRFPPQRSSTQSQTSARCLDGAGPTLRSLTGRCSVKRFVVPARALCFCRCRCRKHGCKCGFLSSLFALEHINLAIAVFECFFECADSGVDLMQRMMCAHLLVSAASFCRKA